MTSGVRENAVLSEEPEPLIPTVPHALEAIVCHCLEKNPRERFQSARDLAFQLRLLPELQNGVSDSVQAIPVTPKKWLPYRASIAAMAVLALAAGGFALFHVRGGGVSQPDSREYRQLTFAEGVAMFPTISADGKMVSYVSLQSGKRDIYEQRVDGRAAINLTGDSPAESSEPAFSPDGSRIAFRSERDGGGIFVMGASGESVRRRTDFGHNPSWSPDGAHFVVSTAAVELQPNGHHVYGDLWIVDERTGAKRLVFEHGTGNDDGRAIDALQPSWSPHGRRIAFWGVSGSGQRDIWTIDPEAPQPKTTLVRLTSNPALHWNPVWSPDGKSLYFGSDRDGTLNLWRIAVDETTGTPAGEAEPLLLPASFSGHFAFSQQGEMVYTTLTRAFRLLAFPFDVKSGRIGAPRLLFGGSLEILTFAPSPDGQLIAFTTAGGQEDVFVARTDGTRLRQLTNDAAKDRIVTWSPDAKTLYFYSNRDGPYQIWSVNADGSGLARVTDEGDLRRKGAGMIALPNVSPDGRTLAAQTDRFAALVHLDRPLGSRLESLEHAIDMPTWSPDGKQLAGNVYKAPGVVVYSLQTGQAEKVLDRGANPLWLPDGRHLVVFEKGSVGIVDLDSRRMRTTPIALPPGVHFGGAGITHLSRDGSTLYLRQTLEQGDIWRMRAENRGHTR